MWHPTRRTRKDGAPWRENAWHTYLMTAYSAAAWDHWQRLEAATFLYGTEVAEWCEQHPRPQLKRFMSELGREWSDRGAVA